MGWGGCMNEKSPAAMNNEFTGSLVIYQTEDGKAQIECRLVDETIWLSQALIGELFDRSKKTISEHLQNLFEEGELDPKSVVRNFRTTAADGKTYAVERYDHFDAKRRQEEAIAADAEDLKTIEDLERKLKRKGGRDAEPSTLRGRRL